MQCLFGIGIVPNDNGARQTVLARHLSNPRLHIDAAAAIRDDDDEWAVPKKNLDFCVHRILMRRGRGRADHARNATSILLL